MERLNAGRIHQTPEPGDLDADDTAEARERIVVEVGGKRLEVVLPSSFGRPSAPVSKKSPKRSRGKAGAATSGDALTSPMQGTIVKVAVEEGQPVEAGDLVVVLEAMKMEQPLTAHKAGVVTALTAEVGQTVTAGALICDLKS